MNIRVNHIVSSIDKSSGGPARSVTHLIETILDNDKDIKISLNTLESNNPIIKSFDSINGTLYFNQFGFLKHSKSLNINLLESNSNLFHGHGLWQLPVHQMAKIARKLKKPYIISPRGMLEPWSLTQGKLKKQLALNLFQFN